MLTNYRLWLWVAVVIMFLTAAFHSLSLFVAPVAQNETERQLIQLMSTYKLDLGGAHPTMGNLFTAVSSCFSLLCFLGALTNAWLLVKKADARLMKGFIAINLPVFTICFVMMLVFTFPPPIVLTGLIAFSLVLAFLTVLRADPVVE